MKANELMVGDWFRFRYTTDGRENVKTFRISQIENELGEYYVWGNGFGRMCYPERLEPIPITPEILEKNFREYLPGINLMYQLKGPYFAMNEEGNQWVFGLVKEDGEKSCRYPLVKITYVHELQHALRLCGIEKEISLC